MLDVKITVMKQVEHKDLIEKFENPIEEPCTMKVGDIFISKNWKQPKGFCTSAWETVSPFVLALATGGESIYDDWMKNKKSAMISCNDGFRPVSFYLETIESLSHNQANN